jgi:stage II sporulation protein D
MRYIIYVFILTCNLIGAQNLRIGLFRASELKKLSIQLSNSEVQLQADQMLYIFQLNQEFKITASGNDLFLDAGDQHLGKFKKLKFNQPINQTATIDCIYPDLKELVYKGNIELTAHKGEINLVNIIDESNYLAGVLKGEAGKNKPISFYETMAIVSRTYMKYYEGRHQKEGYSICDQTHCQVYKGFTNYQPWANAVLATEGIVLKNQDSSSYSEAVFHSNCGGMTASAKSVWRNDIPVCKVTFDPYCASGRHAEWQKKISKDEFKRIAGFQSMNFNNDSLCRLITYCHTGDRPEEIQLGNKVFPSIKLRSMFSLRSAWFDLECESDSIVFTGKGYGHGVGLCQEGAIGMAEQNKGYLDILKFYFRGAIIVDEKLNKVLYSQLGDFPASP